MTTTATDWRSHGYSMMVLTEIFALELTATRDVLRLGLTSSIGSLSDSPHFCLIETEEINNYSLL